MAYDLAALRREREQIKGSITDLENAIAKERDKLSQYDRFIIEAEIEEKRTRDGSTG